MQFRGLAVVALTTILVLQSAHAQEMTAHFIDVGQGDAALLEFPCGAVLIDAGAQDDFYVGHLVDYLTKFFERRADLNGTLDAIFVTHPHIDHNRGLRAVIEHFNIVAYIDNGHVLSRGGANAAWLRSIAKEAHIAIRPVSQEEITQLPLPSGLSDSVIDSVSCSTCDPRITVLAGGWQKNSGWSEQSFSNENNQSLVIRVDFGKSSFLFTGDLEEPAIETLVSWYTDTDMLDVDVYQVGHHGSSNGTTVSLMSAMTPETAVISCGKPSDQGRFSAYSYGHPNRGTIELLESHLSSIRAPVTAQIATRSRLFTEFAVNKAIYATPWDGDVMLKMSLETAIDEITELLQIPTDYTYWATNLPPIMTVDDTFVIELLVGNLEQIQQFIKQWTREQVEPPNGKFKRSEKVTAELISAHIGKIVPVIQGSRTRGGTALRWQWQVVPQTAGLAFISLKMGRDDTYPALPPPHPITVLAPISIQDFLGKNWHWIVTALIIPALGGLIAWLRQRKKKPTEPSRIILPDDYRD